jgi:Na+-transporting NADH:ubiquinone oxidoreductase subunit C
LKSDYKTVYGAAFAHKAETPGLGAEINTPIFEKPFEGKKIVNDNGDFVSIQVKKGGAEKGNLYQVDGITGGTITSDGVAVMLDKTLKVYSDYFQSTQDSKSTVDSLKTDSLSNNLISI